jgi:hypothetical protein
MMKLSSETPSGMRIAATLLRTVFICLLVMVTLRVSMPQSTTVWTVFDSLPDLMRLALGVIVSIWLATQLFWAPKDDDHAHRTWVYLGLALIPVAVVCLLATF